MKRRNNIVTFKDVRRRVERRRDPWHRRTGRTIRKYRPYFFLGVLIGLAAISQPSVVPPTAPFIAERMVVEDHFTRCHVQRSHACVVDGDTIRIDGADIRLVGFNTPEYSDAKCPHERALAEQATIALHKLLNDGPIVLLRDRRNSVDRYDRALRTVMLVGTDGSERPLAKEMISLGLAEPYGGGQRADWC